MQGAKEYANLFTTGTYGKLYIVSSSHARGKTFRIYVLPDGEGFIHNGPSNGPLNSNAVEVYGPVSGQLGWSEVYGWKHLGQWVSDFSDIVQIRLQELKTQIELKDKGEAAKELDRAELIANTLSNY